MSKARKRIFPKPPVKFHSKLETELGRWSNKNGYDASVKGIYSAPEVHGVVNNEHRERQLKTVEKLKANLAKLKGNV